MPNVTSEWPTPAVGPQQTSRPITLVEELERLASGSIVRVVQDTEGHWARFAHHFQKAGRGWVALDGGQDQDEFGSEKDDAFILAHAVLHHGTVGWITLIWDGGNEEDESNAVDTATTTLSLNDLVRQNSALVQDARAAGDRLLEVAGYPAGPHVTLAEGVRVIVEKHHEVQRQLTAAKERIAELEADPSAQKLPDADAISWTDSRGHQHIALKVGGAWQVGSSSPRTEQQIIEDMRVGGGVPRPLDFRADS